MKLHAALCFLVFAGCATSTQNTVKAEQAPAAQVSESQPVRLETSAGTFLVNPGQVEDFKKVLAGEPATKSFYAAGVTE